MNVIMQQGVYSVSDIIEAINEIGMDVTFWVMVLLRTEMFFKRD